MYTPFEINSMDHFRISDTKLSSIILSQTNVLKSWKAITKKCQIELKPKRDGVNTITITVQLLHSITRKTWLLLMNPTAQVRGVSVNLQISRWVSTHAIN